MMLRSGYKCKSICSFCSLSLSLNVSGSRCKNEDFTPAKRLKLEANANTHQALHEALSSKDCGTVCHLLDTGEKLCSTDGIENCFILITKFYNSECLERVLTNQPSAINCRGPLDQTLLMYAKHIDIMKTLFKFEPDVNACNDSGQNVLIRLIRENMNYAIASFDMFFEMALYVLDKGINVSATDVLGKTAIDYVLKFDNSLNCTDPPLRTDILFKKLLKAGAEMPRADSFGRTPAMQFANHRAHLPHYESLIIDLLQQGVDPKARDKHGNNLMHYVISSYYTAIEKLNYCDADHFTSVHNRWFFYADDIADQCFDLLDCGCELGGMDKIYDRHQVISFKVGYDHSTRKVAKSVNILSMLLRFEPFSDFIENLPQHKLNLKKSKRCISELTYYFVDYNDWDVDDCGFEMVDATVAHLLASGVNVMQQMDGSSHLVDQNSDKLEKEIAETIPDALWFAGQIMLRVAEEVRERPDVKKPYYISCKILVSLLRFWNYPPLILFIFLYVDVLKASFSVRTMLKFLARVGGRLPPGSPLFKCLKTNLEKHASRDPNVRVLPQLLKKLHEEVPSLKELCRPVVRATLSKVTTSGLDLSSLRVLFQEKLREVPMDIQDYLNYKDLPVYCEEDLTE